MSLRETGAGQVHMREQQKEWEGIEERVRSDESVQTALRSVPRIRRKHKTFVLSDAVFDVEQRYEIREIVGHGAYGVVCSGFDLARNTPVAVKKIENIYEHRSLAKRTLRELKILRHFKHENIMNLERVMRPPTADFNSIYMVSELMETDLACVIRSPQMLTEEHCQFFIYQVLRGLKYIHSANVIHRDLKPRNLLVNSNCDLKICDFGLARICNPESMDRTVMSNYVATRWYRPPEIILSRDNYTKAVDMWAVGCILAELLGRKPLFPGRDSFHQVTLIISILGSPELEDDDESPPSTPLGPLRPSTLQRLQQEDPKLNQDKKKAKAFLKALPKKQKVPWSTIFPNASPLGCDLLGKLLVFDPDKRLTVEEALRHPYLAELHFEDDEPTCEPFDITDFYFEYLKPTREDLKVLMQSEILGHYSEDFFELKDERPVQFNKPRKASTAPKKKLRRKSWP